MGTEAGTSIVVIGDINADLSFSLRALPREGDDIAAEGLRWNSGGAGLNSAIAYARLGARARLVGRVGSDPAAEVALRAARRAGVDLAHVQTDGTVATGLCGVLVTPGGQRSFVSYRGANVYCDPAAVTAGLLESCVLLSICGHALLEGPQRAATLRALELAEAVGIPVALDLCLPTIRAAGRLLLDLAPRIWLLTMNEDELRSLLPDMSLAQALAQLRERGTYHLAIKRGAQGCSVMEGRQRLDVLPPAVAVLDTTGCGDAFAAGYAWALLHGAALPACAALGNLMGALTATRAGAADALPTRSELAARLDYRLHYLLAPLG